MVLKWSIRLFALILIAIASYLLAGYYHHSKLLYTLIGIFAGLIGIGIEQVLRRKKLKELIYYTLAMGLGIAMGLIFSLFISFIPEVRPYMSLILLISVFVSTYIVVAIFYHKKEEFLSEEGFAHTFRRSRDSHKRSSYYARVPLKLLDTSAIIDGRIYDVARTGFLEGIIGIPRFILRELQGIADAKEHDRRMKGRHGMEIVKKLKELRNIDVKVIDDDVPHIKEVDSKLIELAKRKHAKIITTDYNLQELAEIRGVEVLNINQLALAIKPPVEAGDELKIKIVREGKEQGQGIGYLIDGTMVVVDDAAPFIGKEIDCVVHSVIQQDTGRIVFARLKR